MKELVIEIDFNLWKHVLASNEVYSQIRDHFIEFVEGVRHREREEERKEREGGIFFPTSSDTESITERRIWPLNYRV